MKCEVGTQTTSVDSTVHTIAEQGPSLQMTLVCYVPIGSNQRRPAPFGSEIVTDNDTATKFYTGLSSWVVFFQHHLSFLTMYYPSTKPTYMKLSAADGLLMALMRLRLNLRVEDLAYCFEFLFELQAISSRTGSCDVCSSEVFHQMAYARNCSC